MLSVILIEIGSVLLAAALIALYFKLSNKRKQKEKSKKQEK